MSRPIKSTLAYLVLVGPPFCGLLAILHCGQELEPPRSVGGTWVIDARPGGGTCAVTGTLHVAQSGPHAEATLDAMHAALSLDLDGDHLVGTGSCGVDARLDGDTLTGTLRCADCPATEFHAVRKPRARSAP